jgi:hypothetical protein
VTVFSAPDYPQFQAVASDEERTRNKAAAVRLAAPSWDSATFVQWEAALPRPRADPYYDFEAATELGSSSSEDEEGEEAASRGRGAERRGSGYGTRSSSPPHKPAQHEAAAEAEAATDEAPPAKRMRHTAEGAGRSGGDLGSPAAAALARAASGSPKALHQGPAAAAAGAPQEAAAPAAAAAAEGPSPGLCIKTDRSPGSPAHGAAKPEAGVQRQQEGQARACSPTGRSPKAAVVQSPKAAAVQSPKAAAVRSPKAVAVQFPKGTATSPQERRSLRSQSPRQAAASPKGASAAAQPPAGSPCANGMH